MIEEAGRVVAVDGEGVWVEGARSSACATCSASKGCGQRVLAEFSSRARQRIRVDNPAQLTVAIGDQVMIGVGEGSFLRASLVLYLLPLLLLFAGGYIGSALGASELSAVLGGLAGLLAGLGAARVLGQRLGRSCQYQPILIKII